MTNQEIAELLRASGALMTDTHVAYTSGAHGSTYFNKDAIYPHTELISRLCGEIACRFSDEAVDVVIAPAVGGIILSQWTAHHLSKLVGREVLAVYAEKSEGGFVLRRGYDALVRDRQVLVVEDVLTTGGSAKKVVNLVLTYGGAPVGVGVLCNRGSVSAEVLGTTKLEALFTPNLDTWGEGNCPLCAKGIPLNTGVGHGKSRVA